MDIWQCPACTSAAYSIKNWTYWVGFPHWILRVRWLIYWTRPLGVFRSSQLKQNKIASKLYLVYSTKFPKNEFPARRLLFYYKMIIHKILFHKRLSLLENGFFRTTSFQIKWFFFCFHDIYILSQRVPSGMLQQS